MTQEEIVSNINEKWGKHLENWRLKLLVELGEEWIIFLNQLRFSDPHTDVTEYTDMIHGYRQWEITVHYPATNFYESVAGSCKIGTYQITGSSVIVGSNIDCTNWRVNGERIARNLVLGEGFFKFITRQSDLYAEHALNNLWDDFGLKKLIRVSES